MEIKIIKIYEKDFCECFKGNYSVGTEGYTGGDGGATFIEFNFSPGGGIEIKQTEKGFKILAKGDSELNYFIEAFVWISKKLREQIKEKQ